MTHYSFPQLLRHEFAGYNIPKFRQDLLAGLTVAAVALPLALAFAPEATPNASEKTAATVIAPTRSLLLPTGKSLPSEPVHFPQALRSGWRNSN
jgi:hypothetical protein